MAGGAGGVKPEVGPPEILSGRCQRRVAKQRGLVALAACELGVCAAEDEAGESMIETGGPLLPPPDQLIVATVVLDVAGSAIPIRGPGVKTLSRRDSLRQGFMAGEAPFRSHPLARLVAEQTVRAPLELGVRSGQRPRRDLRPGRRHQTRQDRKGERRHGALAD